MRALGAIGNAVGLAKKPRRTITSFRRDTARRLRANATGAEELLWQRLRRSPMLGSHFRRQVPVGPYIADFACMAAKLIIEVDGSQHGTDAGKARDDERTRWLENEGYRILRFWNNDLTSNMDGVLEMVHKAIFGSLSPDEMVLKHRRSKK